MSADLVRDLRALGDELDWPATPDLAASVTARLEEARDRDPRRGAWRAGRRRALAAALALLVLVPATGAVAFPGARDDVLEWLGLKSVEVRREPELPRGARPAAPNDLGSAVSYAEAARRAGFEPLLPPRLGKPQEIRVRGDVVTVVYAGGLRLAQRRGALERDLLRKIVGMDTDVRAVPGGIFITGRHGYLYLDPAGEVRQEQTRIASNTLITERGDVLLRLEGDETLTSAEARRLIAP